MIVLALTWGTVLAGATSLGCMHAEAFSAFWDHRLLNRRRRSFGLAFQRRLHRRRRSLGLALPGACTGVAAVQL